MKARELIEQLLKLDPDIEITHEDRDFQRDVVYIWNFSHVDANGEMWYGDLLESWVTNRGRNKDDA